MTPDDMLEALLRAQKNVSLVGIGLPEGSPKEALREAMGELRTIATAIEGRKLLKEFRVIHPIEAHAQDLMGDCVRLVEDENGLVWSCHYRTGTRWAD